MGIASALVASANELNFVIACDIPHMRLNFVRKLLSQAAKGSADIIVPMTHEGKCEPLFAVYRRSVVKAMNEVLSTGHRKISDVFALCKVAYFELGEGLPNLNTITEYQQFQKRLNNCS
jgi:molybdopterin-guanine dinucleotide biosynthesis protein A